MRNKYNARKCEYKGIKFDSILERNQYVLLYQMQETGKISDLEKVDSSIILVKMGSFLKNGKLSKQADIKYKPDFTFYAIDLDFYGHKLKDINVIMEAKSSRTAKARDYSLRRRLYLNTLKKDEIFVEFIDSRNDFKVIVWEAK